MLQTFRNAWKVPELKAKLLFTLIIIVVYRLGSQIPVPFVSSDILNHYINTSATGSLFQYLNILSGEAFAKASLFALAVSPYITASIVMQLLCIAIPALEKISKDGEEGKKKINTITRYVTVGLAIITAYGYYAYMNNTVGAVTDYGTTFLGGLTIVVCYVAGASIIMWLAEKINEHGIGNGISMILFANIVSTGFSFVGTIYEQYKSGILNISESWPNLIWATLTLVISLAIVTFVVFFTNSERRIPVQYAKRVVGRKMYGGQSTTLPIKLNMSGVMPIIFASSIVSLPQTLGLMFGTGKTGGFWNGFLKLFEATSPLYIILYTILIVAFAYFYIAISFNPVEVANNLKKQGGFVPGIRPGRPTADYITKILRRITLLGAIFLIFIAVLPLIVNAVASAQLGALAFGGSSLLIVVGVIQETVRDLEAQTTMRHYKGFLE